MNSEIKYGGAFLIFSITLFLFFKYCIPSNECGDTSYFKKKYFNSMLMMKYLDKEQHNYQTIEIKGKKIYVMHYEKSKFYDYIEVGDSLYKPKGSLAIKVIRGDSDTTFIIDFGCEN